MSIPTAVSQSEALPVTSETRPLLRALPVPPRLRETPRSVEERARQTAADARKAERELATLLSVSDEAGWAYADLNHALLLAEERGQDVPCQGAGSDAWTSDDYDDQQVAADRCLDCPAMALCEKYRAIARPTAGTWAGVTSSPARKSHEPKPRADVTLAYVGSGCRCGCGGQPKRGRYLAGHDSRHLSALLVAVRADAYTLDQAIGELAHSERLQSKLIRYLDGR